MTGRPPRHGMERSGRRAGWLRGLLAGAVLLSSIGSCELPKPQLPSIGAAPARPAPSVVQRV